MSWQRRTALIAAGGLAGIIAALVMTLVMVVGRYWLGTSPPPEALPDRFAPTLDIASFFELFDRFGGYNGLKKFGVRTGIQGLFALGIGFGMIYSLVVESGWGRSKGRSRVAPSRAGLYFIAGTALVLWVAMLVVLWPVLGANFRGLPPSRARFASALWLLVDFVTFGAALIVTYHAVVRPDQAPVDAIESAAPVDPVDMPRDESSLARPGRPVGRRAVVAAMVGAIIALPSVGLIRRLYDRATFDYDGRPYSGPGVQAIAPNDKFYTVTKNVVDPNIAKSVWGLEITGLVERSVRIDFDDLSGLSATEQETTLMCISNKIGAGLFSNAVWTGVPMADLLMQAGVRDGAVEVLLRAADGYTDTFAIEKALDPTTMVVYKMNGDPLPERHGFPARVIVPGLFGEKNVKWITGIEVIDHDGKGFYEQQGWGPSFVIPTRSDIFAPGWTRRSGGDSFNQPFKAGTSSTIKGRAFGGDRGIQSVEVSTDDGETWKPVRIDYPGTNLTWTFWSYAWTPPTAGEYVITSRAVDGDGQPQPVEKRGIIAQGATGYHKVKATVV